MVYAVAVLLSVVVCALAVVSGGLSGNITHLEQGRKRNAGVSLFPMIPVFQLLALGLAWLLELLVPTAAIWVLVLSFAVLLAFWLVEFRNLRSKLRKTLASSNPSAGA